MQGNHHLQMEMQKYSQQVTNFSSCRTQAQVCLLLLHKLLHAVGSEPELRKCSHARIFRQMLHSRFLHLTMNFHDTSKQAAARCTDAVSLLFFQSSSYLQTADRHAYIAGQQQQYILAASGLLEVNRVKHAACSWLVGESFISGARQQLRCLLNT